MSADIFSFKEDIYVAMSAPNTNSCVIMEWDHIEMNFRKFDSITGLTTFIFYYPNYRYIGDKTRKQQLMEPLCHKNGLPV